jgi:hypothetical protein
VISGEVIRVDLANLHRFHLRTLLVLFEELVDVLLLVIGKAELLLRLHIK